MWWIKRADTEAARREFTRVQRIFAAAGTPDACHHVVCRGGHRFYADAAWSLFLSKYGQSQR